MPITVIVRSATGNEARLTFDGVQSVVIGRGTSCDVRLPDVSVSHRHASLRARGADFVLIDEGSTNGTFVGGVRVAPRTSRIVRSGDMVRLGRMWIELRIGQAPVTRDVAGATRDLALAFVSDALAAMGTDQTTRVRVVEGRDQGATLPLAEEGRLYVMGRAATCDLPLADPDASREHAGVIRKGTVVCVRDLGAKNGTWLGETRIASERDSVWRPAQMAQIGRTVLALEEPVSIALARLESAADEPMAADEAIAPPPPPSAYDVPIPPTQASPGITPESRSGAPLAAPQLVSKGPASPSRARWSAADLAVMAAAVGVLALSIAGLIWLLKT
jgi:pSer/pThr/pTyr-binding forkhead associated (FHA) protein